MPAWQRHAAHSLHGLLYVLMFAVPLSGYFYSLAAGVPVVFREAEGNIHGFINLRRAIPSSAGDIRAGVEALKLILAEATA